MSTERNSLTPAEEQAAREAFETRLKGYRWWLEHQGEQHPALRKDENGEYVEQPEGRRWEGFQAGYLAGLAATRDKPSSTTAALRKTIESAPDPEDYITTLGGEEAFEEHSFMSDYREWRKNTLRQLAERKRKP